MEYFVCMDDNGICYELDQETQTAAVIESDNEDEEYQGEIQIPDVVIYEGVEYTVTAIVGLAFYNCSGLTSITIPDTVTSMGWGVFDHCESLTSITIPDSVTTIRYYYSDDGNIYTALCPISRHAHEIRPFTCRLAWDFMKKYSRNPDGRIVINQ